MNALNGALGAIAVALLVGAVALWEIRNVLWRIVEHLDRAEKARLFGPDDE